MFLQDLGNKYHSLITHMEETGYSSDYIGRIKYQIKFILTEAKNRGWKSYDDVYRYYETTSVSINNLKRIRTYLGRIMDYDHDGKYPDGKRTKMAQTEAYTKLVPEYQRLIDWYRSTERERGKKDSSIKTESQNVASFLLSLQNAGIVNLGDVTEEAVLKVFMSSNGKPHKSHTNRKFISSFFKKCMVLEQEACKKVISFIPMTRKYSKNVQYLKPQEVQLILTALEDMTNTLSLRDRAIGKLAFYTGLRSCDIAALDLSSIDWERDIISIKQQKTGTPLEISLSAVFGNAIYDYVINERPFVNCPSVFITTGKPYKRMLSSSMWEVSTKIMDEAFIRQSKGDRKGLHLFRHNLATSLMGNGVPQAVVSEALGQTAPESLEAYLSTDIAHLRGCALSIGHFPVGEGVFTDA